MGAAQEGGKDHGSPLGLARDHQSDLIDLRSNPGQADHCHLDTDVCSGPSAVVGAGKLGREPGVGCGLGGGREALTQDMAKVEASEGSCWKPGPWVCG